MTRPIIVNLRGTHGSGKSTVAAHILNKYAETTEVIPGADLSVSAKIAGYIVTLPNASKLFIVGPYHTACGGCDAIHPYGNIWPRIVWAVKRGMHVLFEGALVSSSYGNIGRSSEVYGDNMIFAFLDTPLEICIERVKSRRLAKGNDKPLDPTNTVAKYTNIQKSIPKIRDVFGRKTVVVNHLKPVTEVLKLFGVVARKEP